MKQALLEDTVIHADETTVQVLKENGKTAASESRMWVYASGEGSKKPIRIFEYQPDRNRISVVDNFPCNYFILQSGKLSLFCG